MAIATILSPEFEGDGDESWGTPEPDLERIAADIRAGKGVSFDETTLKRYEQSVEAFLTVEPRIFLWLFHVFRPAILLLGALLVVWLLLRAMR